MQFSPKVLILALFFFISVNINAQSFKITQKLEITTNNITVLWDNIENSKTGINNFYFDSPVGFSCFSFGVKTKVIDKNNFTPEYRLFFDNKWTDWKTGEFDYLASEVKSGMISSELFFTPTQELYNKIEFRILTDKKISEIIFVAYDVLSDKKIHEIKTVENNIKSVNECPSIPTIVGREIWLYPYYSSQSYTPTPITPDHVVIHHGAVPDTYTDGAAIVRSYWNYHVNTLGWSDLGYNYLLDKYGNIFQGRKNTNIASGDVRGAHAGAANSESIGVNFLGNADVTQPTSVQLQSCSRLLAWWFNSRGYNPTESDNMTTQNSGILSIPRISGHRDVNIGGTSCPGDVLYAELPSIRIQTQAIIDNCNGFAETEISSVNQWKKQDFVSFFTDTATNGIKEKFYQVIDFDGAVWAANTDYGFFADNFTTLNSNWQQVDGTWSSVNNYLFQEDETSSNTILSTELNQNDEDSYLYNFTAMIAGSGTNKRAGLHFMCSSPNLENRGNSYFVYYRTDYARVEIYKVEDNILDVKVMEDYTMQDEIYYDFKIIFLKTTGEIIVYIDNQKIASWIDTNPYQTGNYISMRTGNCTLKTSELKVYHSRGASENISLGDNTKEIRFQNPSPSVFSAKVKSIIVDNNYLLSSIYYHNLNVDWTEPTDVSVIDGLGADADSFNTETSISAKWNKSIDVNSNTMQYWYSIGTTVGDDDVFGWTATTDTFIVVNSLNLVEGQIYYTNIESENNASLLSNIISSDGQVLDLATSIGKIENNISIYPNPTSSKITVNSNFINKEYKIYNSVGSIVLSGVILNNNFNINIENLIEGVYFFSIDSKAVVVKLVKIKG